MNVIDARNRFQGAYISEAVTPEGKSTTPVKPSVIKIKKRNWFKYILTMLGK